MGTSLKNAQFLIESRMRDAARGNPDALYDLGVCYSTGTSGVEVNLIEAHKFFHRAAVSGLD
ncbi:MAG: SEL1-like repeat protein, partial [Sphingomonas bacterium]|nr:SEL1-like repeat protein [Sphingomonas bacterium]